MSSSLRRYRVRRFGSRKRKFLVASASFDKEKSDLLAAGLIFLLMASFSSGESFVSFLLPCGSSDAHY